MYGIFDSHAHYDDKPFDPDRDELLSRVLPQAGIIGVVNIGNDTPSIASSYALAQRYDYVYCAAGHHPHSAKDVGEHELLELRDFLTRPKVVALGEIGLDYHYDFSPRDVQRRVFREQLEIAKEMDKPVVIHSREATADTMALLREFKPRGIVHCFSGSAETAREILSLGMYIGFTGVVTFTNARKTLEAAAAVPLERLLIETDCPYMAPVPMRGKRCDSTMLPYTLRALAAVKGVDEETLAAVTAANAYAVYGITPPDPSTGYTAQ